MPDPQTLRVRHISNGHTWFDEPQDTTHEPQDGQRDEDTDDLPLYVEHVKFLLNTAETCPTSSEIKNVHACLP